jgi:hypothetical protein
MASNKTRRPDFFDRPTADRLRCRECATGFLPRVVVTPGFQLSCPGCGLVSIVPTDDEIGNSPRSDAGEVPGAPSPPLPKEEPNA